MTVLGTNVISEALKPSADGEVMAWLNDQAAETLYFTSVTLAELLYGIDVLPKGRRKDSLTQTLNGLLNLFGEPVLSFDVLAAEPARSLPSPHVRQAGDSRVRTVALPHRGANGCTVATRDTGPFRATGVPVIDPWTASVSRECNANGRSASTRGGLPLISESPRCAAPSPHVPAHTGPANETYTRDQARITSKPSRAAASLSRSSRQTNARVAG